MHFAVLGLAFFFVFDFARSPTTPIPDACLCGRWQAVSYAPAVSLQPRVILVGLACLARCHARLHGSVSPYLRSLGFVRRSRAMVTACNNSVVLPCSSSDSTKLLLPQPVLRHWVSNTSSKLLLTVFRRLLLCPILLISGFSAIPAPSLQTLALARHNTLSFFLACSVIAHLDPVFTPALQLPMAHPNLGSLVASGSFFFSQVLSRAI